ncbi:MAG: N-acetylglucosamine-6-phosphate deacetylase [Succinivibrio sp.]
MAVTVIKNARLHITSEEFVDANSFAIMDHRIVPMEPSLLEDGTAEEIDVRNMHVCPGFIDLLVNGCSGVSFGQAPSIDTLEQMRRFQTLYGTTTFVPTLVSSPRETLTRAMAAISEFKEKHPTICPGIHLEGPFISSTHKGFHPSGYIRPFGDPDKEFVLEQRDIIAYMTIAPEVVRPKYIVDLVNNHVNLSLGHTSTTYYEAMQAFKAGVKNVTHLYNGMRSPIGREPGLVGAVLQSDNVYAGIIADGRHVHPALVKLAHRLLGDRLYIVSDSQSVTGMTKTPSSFIAGGSEVFVDHKRGLIDSKGAYAGTSITMFDGIKFLINQCGFTLDEALLAATYSPARAIGLQDCGRIEGGFIADLVIFDDDFKIQYVIQNGFVKSIAELM